MLDLPMVPVVAMFWGNKVNGLGFRDCCSCFWSVLYFCRILQIGPGPKCLRTNLSGFLFYRSDALPVTQRTVSKAGWTIEKYFEVCCMFQTLPSTKGRTGEGFGTSPRNVYMSDSMPNRSGSHRGVVVARPYPAAATSVPAVSLAAHPADIPSSYGLGSAAVGCGPIQSRTAPRRRRGVFTSLGKGFVSTLKGSRGISSTSAPNLGDVWLCGGLDGWLCMTK